jgi:hypothetical protein
MEGQDKGGQAQFWHAEPLLLLLMMMMNYRQNV